MLYRARIVICPRRGVSDPEGDTLSWRLKRKGIAGIDRVRSGRYWEIYLEANSKEEAEALVRQIYNVPPIMNPVKDDSQLLAIEEVK
jgi:phosphoribosylformylglycinamidine (FGAM) synthase PurS component